MSKIKVNEQRAVDEFQELTAIDAPSFGERQMADRLIVKLKRKTMPENISEETPETYMHIFREIFREIRSFCPAIWIRLSRPKARKGSSEKTV